MVSRVRGWVGSEPKVAVTSQVNKLNKAESKRGGNGGSSGGFNTQSEFKSEERVKVKEGGCMGGRTLADPFIGWRWLW